MDKRKTRSKSERAKRAYFVCELDPHEVDYLNACCRIRDLALSALLRRLVGVIAKDHLVASILDDEENLRERAPSEHSSKLLKDEFPFGSSCQ